MTTGRDPARYWIEIDTEPIGNFVMPLSVATGKITRSVTRDKRVVSLSVNASDLDRGITIHATVVADDALNAIWYLTSLVERAATRDNLGAITIRRLRSVPEADVAWHPPVATPEPEVPVQPRLAPPTSLTLRPVKHSRANLGWALLPLEKRETGTDRVRTLTGQIAGELRAHGADDVARSLERWLAPEIAPAVALRGLRHVLFTVQDLATHMTDTALSRDIDVTLREIAATGALRRR